MSRLLEEALGSTASYPQLTDTVRGLYWQAYSACSNPRNKFPDVHVVTGAKHRKLECGNETIVLLGVIENMGAAIDALRAQVGDLQRQLDIVAARRGD
jgi:hypothetical protein